MQGCTWAPGTRSVVYLNKGTVWAKGSPGSINLRAKTRGYVRETTEPSFPVCCAWEAVDLLHGERDSGERWRKRPRDLNACEDSQRTAFLTRPPKKKKKKSNVRYFIFDPVWGGGALSLPSSSISAVCSPSLSEG